MHKIIYQYGFSTHDRAPYVSKRELDEGYKRNQLYLERREKSRTRTFENVYLFPPGAKQGRIKNRMKVQKEMSKRLGSSLACVNANEEQTKMELSSAGNVRKYRRMRNIPARFQDLRRGQPEARATIEADAELQKGSKNDLSFGKMKVANRNAEEYENGDKDFEAT